MPLSLSHLVGTRAPGLVQHLIARVLAAVDRESILIIHYLDDILLLGHDKALLRVVTQRAADTLTRTGYLISPKSICDPTQELPWMGKLLDLRAPRTAPLVGYVADVVARWVRLVLRPYHHKSLRRLLGNIVWLGRPAACIGSFLAGPRAWLNHDPYWSARTPLHVVCALLEAIAVAFRGWDPSPVATTPQSSYLA